MPHPSTHMEMRMSKFNVRTVFVHDWPLTLAGMEHIAGSACAIELVGAYQSAGDFVASLGGVEFDVALVDYAMRGDSQVDALNLFEHLRDRCPHAGIVALVTHESAVIVRSMLARGVLSVVSKFDDVGHIVTAIHSSFGGGRHLSPTVRRTLDTVDHESGGPVKLSPCEIEVIRLYLSGIPVKTIAKRLSKGKQTVSAQKISAMKKLGVTNDVELIKRATSFELRDGVSGGVGRDMS